MRKTLFPKIGIGIVCLSVLLQAFTACKGNPEHVENPSESIAAMGGDTTGDQQISSGPKENYFGYLNEYRIVRPNSITDNYCVGACKRLEDALSEASGKKVVSVVDTRQKDDGGKEILIGRTNRTESEDALETLDENEFSISVVENKIVIVGENSIALDQGVKYFTEHYIYDLKSASEIKPYRKTDSYGYSPISELNQYVYGEPACTYAGCIQQDVAFDFATGDIYYSMADQFCAEDSAIVRRTPNGHQEYMILTKFGHMETFDIERVGDKVYIWVGSQAASNTSNSTAISRFEFQAGKRYEWNTGETFSFNEKYYNPALDPVNDYVSNWGKIYDRKAMLNGDFTPVANITNAFPYEAVGYSGSEYAISGGYDLCGSYVYTCWQTFDKDNVNKIIVTVHNAKSELVDWTILDSQVLSGIKDPEVNGIKAEIINGVPRVFVAFASDSGINRRYKTTVVVFAERPFELVEPTVESLSQLKTVEHNKLPKNAEKTRWTEAGGVLSIKAYGNMRLTFDEAAFKGEAYTYETTVTIDTAQEVGINLACSANVSNGNDFYQRNNYIGAQIVLSKEGKLTVNERESKVLKEYTIPVKNTYHLKVFVNENGQMTITLNGEKIGVLELSEAYIGGHVGVFAKNGIASFANTKLTYHHP